MNELLKKGFYLGLGAGAMVKESLEKTMDEASQRGQEMSGDGSQMAKDVLNEMGEQLDALASKGEAAFGEQLSEAGIVTRAELDEVLSRLTEIEAKLALLEGKIS